jgi:hypothetical protein
MPVLPELLAMVIQPFWLKACVPITVLCGTVPRGCVVPITAYDQARGYLQTALQMPDVTTLQYIGGKLR